MNPKLLQGFSLFFLKDKERRIKEILLDDDFKLARRLVNGGSHGLTEFTDAYNIGDDLIA